jgi:RND family efflux transporter MFP subunit
MKNDWLHVIALSILIIVTGCTPSGEPKAVADKPRPVRTETIQRRDLPITVHAVGRLVPDREVVVSAQVTGIVTQLNADVGTKVATDDTLVRLDPLDYTLALNEAEANLRSAQARLSAAENSYQRAQQLLPEKAISVQLFDTAEAEFRTARAQVSQVAAAVDIARQRLGKTVIRSPFDGHVTRRMVELGQNVAVGDPVMDIADMKTMRVRIYINEQDYVRLDKQDPVTVTVEAYPEAPVAGRVDKIGIKADPRTNTFEVELLLENPAFRFKAGLTARVSIQTDVIADAVLIPQGSVLFREDHQEVFVVEEGGLAAVRQVRLGRVDGSVVRILQGLQPGDTLVVAGAQYLKSGDKVAVAP